MARSQSAGNSFSGNNFLGLNLTIRRKLGGSAWSSGLARGDGSANLLRGHQFKSWMHQNFNLLSILTLQKFAIGQKYLWHPAHRSLWI